MLCACSVTCLNYILLQLFHPKIDFNTQKRSFCHFLCIVSWWAELDSNLELCHVEEGRGGELTLVVILAKKEKLELYVMSNIRLRPFVLVLHSFSLPEWGKSDCIVLCIAFIVRTQLQIRFYQCLVWYRELWATLGMISYYLKKKKAFLANPTEEENKSNQMTVMCSW